MNNGRFCRVCKIEKELTTCDRCMTDMQREMLERLLKDNPDQERTQKMLKEIMEEIQDLKKSIAEFKVKGLTIKAVKQDVETLF